MLTGACNPIAYIHLRRYTTVLSNTAREVGLYEKQSSFYVQAKTAQSIIRGNVFFNGACGVSFP